MAQKFNSGDMVRTKESRDTRFLEEKIEGIVVGITHPAGGHPFIINQIYLYLIQDKDGAHYNYVDERWLEPSNAPRFQPKKLKEGCLVCLSPHSSKKSLLNRNRQYSVKEVEDNMATLILGKDETTKVHAENLKIIR